MSPAVDDALIERFLDAVWMERGLSQNTLSAYRSDLSKFAVWLNANAANSIEQAQRQNLLDYLAEQSKRSKSPDLQRACSPVCVSSTNTLCGKVGSR